MDLTIDFDCPTCATSQWLDVPPDVSRESFWQDCGICCRPLRLDIQRDDEGRLSVVVTSTS